MTTLRTDQKIGLGFIAVSLLTAVFWPIVDRRLRKA